MQATEVKLRDSMGQARPPHQTSIKNVNLRLTVPDKTLKYILYQRTDCQKIPFGDRLFSIDKLFGGKLYKSAVALQTGLQPDQIRKQYSAIITHEYSVIEPYLPREARVVADVGCGVGGLDVFLSRHYGGKAELYLVDRTEVQDRIYYGFKPHGAFYNSLSAAKSLLVQNGVEEPRIHLIDARVEDLSTIRNVDLCISLLSWGFHYPVDTYSETVKKFMKKGGVLILDVKKGTGGETELHNTFHGRAQTIMETPNRSRVLVSV